MLFVLVIRDDMPSGRYPAFIGKVSWMCPDSRLEGCRDGYGKVSWMCPGCLLVAYYIDPDEYGMVSVWQRRGLT